MLDGYEAEYEAASTEAVRWDGILAVIAKINVECALAMEQGIASPQKHWVWAMFYAENLDLNTSVTPDRADVSTWAELVKKRRFLHENPTGSTTGSTTGSITGSTTDRGDLEWI